MFKRFETSDIYSMAREAVIVAVIVALASALAFIALNANRGSRFRSDYAGKIIDKGLRTYESEEGSSMENYLTIEEKDGTRSQVVVSASVYEQAKPGMWIEKGKAGIKLIDLSSSSEGR